MTARHTPGPWFAHNIGLGPDSNGPYTYPLGRDADTAVANARLIASAPELLAALRDDERWLRHEHGCPASYSNVCSCGLENFKSQRRAAIAHAEGRE